MHENRYGIESAAMHDMHRRSFLLMLTGFCRILITFDMAQTQHCHILDVLDIFNDLCIVTWSFLLRHLTDFDNLKCYLLHHDGFSLMIQVKT